MTEATHFSQCVHDQQRRLEADDCDSIRCAQLISGGRRRIRPPCTVPRSRSPHNVLHSPSLLAHALLVNLQLPVIRKLSLTPYFLSRVTDYDSCSYSANMLNYYNTRRFEGRAQTVLHQRIIVCKGQSHTQPHINAGGYHFASVGACDHS